MKNSSAWIIGALLLAALANDASEFNSLACSGFTVKTLFDLDKHSIAAWKLLPVHSWGSPAMSTAPRQRPQKWALIPVVLLGICLGMPLGAFTIWKILDQRCRQAGDQLGNTERLLADVPEDDDLQAQLLASVFFGVAHEVKTKPTAPVKQDQDLHSLLGNTKDEPPDLIDFMDLESSVAPSRPLSFPDSRNLTMELECLEKFQQEFKDKRKHS
ncbi:hypothetical protein SELMODRAFT_409050 [Selaginella moellendorffii]|uniref:Uncharacterized protein n=1 Tax=Selaginella moellendorffii TaxID=88036 RepID=D8R9A0_SELML|nr:hypothetical protein SELMODRAFT_409050 [Selaginella moellendorffii]